MQDCYGRLETVQVLVLDGPSETKNDETGSKGQDLAQICRGSAETILHGSHGAIRKGLLEFGPAILAAVLSGPK
jgi:hypothetical protein